MNRERQIGSDETLTSFYLVSVSEEAESEGGKYMYISIWLFIMIIYIAIMFGFMLCALLTVNRYDDERSEEYHENNRL